MKTKDYIVIVQCHIVMERCSGYFCERAFNERTGGFSDYPKEKTFRTLYLTCGGCCGRAVHRKLGNLISKIASKESIEKEHITVHLSSCITKDNYHGPPCPHRDYLKIIIQDKLGLALREGSSVSKASEKRRRKSVYHSKNGHS